MWGRGGQELESEWEGLASSPGAALGPALEGWRPVWSVGSPVVKGAG